MPKPRAILTQFVITTLFLLLLLNGCTKSNQVTLEANNLPFGELDKIADGKTDKCKAGHGFTDFYEQLLLPLKDSATKVCEIGIASGGSIVVWQEYFKNATVYAIDIEDYSNLNSPRVKTFVADQANRKLLHSFIRKYKGDYDFILDDGGHSMEQQQVSFGFLFEYVKPGGYYIIEDVHTSLNHLYGGYGVKEDQSNTTLKMINNYMQTGVLRSEYLTKEEVDYLNRNIEYCTLFFRNDGSHSMACAFKKSESTDRDNMKMNTW